MAKTIDVQEGGIVLADNWKLWPRDERNWELCVRREVPDNARAREAGTIGTMRWQKFGRSYPYNAVEQAVLFVADNVLKAGCADEAMGLREALDEYRSIVRELSDALTRAVAS